MLGATGDKLACASAYDSRYMARGGIAEGI